jgi:hypothetical protein
MRGCAWLTGIDRHALHASLCEQAEVACEALFKVEPSRSRGLHLLTLFKVFRLRITVRRDRRGTGERTPPKMVPKDHGQHEGPVPFFEGLQHYF